VQVTKLDALANALIPPHVTPIEISYCPIQRSGLPV
jgi:hypothetical protein